MGARVYPELRERIAAGPALVLDGALGSEIERRGGSVELPLWSTHALLEAPSLVQGIHRDYLEAGADVLTANTFRTQRRVLAAAGLGDRARELTEKAVALARSVTREAARRVFVVGSAPPLEDCYRPELSPSDEGLLAREHGEHLEHLAAAGVDAVLIETMNTIREARAAVRESAERGLPALVSFVCGEAPALLSGEPLAQAIESIVEFEPLAVGVNCVAPKTIDACLPVLRESGVAFAVYANHYGDGIDPDAFAQQGGRFVDAGARLVGGCCGTRPDHIAALATRLRSQR